MVRTANLKVALFGATAALVLMFGAFLVTNSMASAQTPPTTPAPTQSAPAQPGQTTPAQPGQAAPNGQQGQHSGADCPGMGGSSGSGTAPSGSGTSFGGGGMRGSQVRY